MYGNTTVAYGSTTVAYSKTTATNRRTTVKPYHKPTTACGKSVVKHFPSLEAGKLSHVDQEGNFPGAGMGKVFTAVAANMVTPGEVESGGLSTGLFIAHREGPQHALPRY